MRIAFTHNLRLSTDESQAEFDSPHTISTLTIAMEKLGHTVTPIDVSGPSSQVIAMLEASKPDLVFNMAEGKEGRFREAFYPSLFEEMGLPFTASDSHTCTVTLDKHLTKLIVDRLGVLTPKWKFICSAKDLSVGDLTFPLFVKPNFEGSSKGIHADSLVQNQNEFEHKAKNLLLAYPEGILVEEYVDGQDVAVAYVNGISQTGVLPPCSYRFAGEHPSAIYDYDLKNDSSENVEVDLAKLSKEQTSLLMKISSSIFEHLNIHDLGRIDFRIDKSGRVYFLEINALPSLEPGAGIYLSAASLGATTTEAVLKKIIDSASRRFKIRPRSQRGSSNLKVGIAYNLKRIYPQANGEQDHEAEFDSSETIDSIACAIAKMGFETVRLEATSALMSQLAASPVDIVFNIAEGLKGRNRESQVPALLELLNIEYTGSDATTMSVTLDKWMGKKIVAENGVLTAKSAQVFSLKDKLPTNLSYPLIIKPAQEGSSKGIFSNSVVRNQEELRQRVMEFLPRYRQPLLVEEYITGREFTVGVLGGSRPKVLPVMEIIFEKSAGEHPVYSFEHKLNFCDQVRYEIPAKLDETLHRKLTRIAKTCFQSLHCRDVARIDFRMDEKGNIYFLECNPLPGLVPGWSDLTLMAKAGGMEYQELIANILAPALKRFHQNKNRASEKQPVEKLDLISTSLL